jgi:hypothetical protein
VLQAKVFLAFTPVHEPETAPHRNARLAGLKDITTILHRYAASWSHMVLHCCQCRAKYCSSRRS